MQIQPFKDFKINNSSDEEDVNYYTVGTCIIDPSGGRTGRVDHWRKHSIKAIVNAYVKQFVLRENMKGKHIVEIELATEFLGLTAKTLEIEITN